jgi:hypothetical protein
MANWPAGASPTAWLRPDEPAGSGGQDQRADPTGLAGSAWVRDDGVPRPVRAGAPVPGCAAFTTALDNTWGAGLAFSPFDLDGHGLGVDISVQALTKYPSGGGDVLMGSVITRDEALHLKLKLSHMRLGSGVGANDGETVLRSLAQHCTALPRSGSGSAGAGTLVQGKPAPVCPGAASGACPARRATCIGNAFVAPKPDGCHGSGCWSCSV